MKTIIKYDLMYFKKTSKFIIIGVLGVFLSGLSVLSAKYFNAIIEFGLRQEGYEIELPPSTVAESYIQFFTNFTQIYMLVMMFLAIAFFTQDKTKGHIPLIFSKPIKRSDYILSKSMIMTFTILASLIIASLFFAYYTFMLFGTFAWVDYLIGMIAFYVFILLMMHVALVFSVVFNNYFLPLISTLGVFFALSILTILDGGIFKFFPQHLISYPLLLLDGKVEVSTVFITTGIGLTLSVLCLLLSLRIFKTKSLL